MKAVTPITWRELNKQLRSCTELQAESLLKRVRKEGRSTQFVMRVAGRLTKLRKERQTKEIVMGKGA
jgi:hypothetical protein